MQDTPAITCNTHPDLLAYSSREKARKPYSVLWGGMASGGLGAAAPIMAFSLESPLDISHGQAHEIK